MTIHVLTLRLVGVWDSLEALDTFSAVASWLHCEVDQSQPQIFISACIFGGDLNYRRPVFGHARGQVQWISMLRPGLRAFYHNLV